MIFASIFRSKKTSPNNSDSNTNDGHRDDYGSTVNDHNNKHYDVEEDGNGLLLKTNNNNETTPLMEPPTTRRGVSEASTVITGSGTGRGLGSSYTTTNTGSNSDRSSNNKNDENKHSSSLRHGSTFLMSDSYSSDVFAGVTQGGNQRSSTTSTAYETNDDNNGDNDDEAHPSFDEDSKTKQSEVEEEEEATNLSSSWSRKLFKRSTSNSTQGSLMKSIYDHLPLKGSFAEMDKTDYTPNLLQSTSELLKPWEYIITPDHFGTWKRHVAWAKKDGATLRDHTAQRFSSNTVFMTLLLNSELATLFNSATITTEMRQDLYEGNVTSMKFYIGMVIIMSTFITIYAIISTFTVWGMVTVLSDENSLCVLRSSIGQYATQLPSRLVATALCLFLCWVSMFLFILLPIEVALTITIGSTVLYLHIVHVYSNFGRLIIHSGAMGNQPIFSSKEEEHMRPEEFHNLLSERAGSTAARKMSVVHQYKNVSELLSKRLSVFSVGAFANIVPETDDGIIDDDGDEQSVTVALKQRTTPPRAPGGGGLFGGGGLRQRRAAIGGRGISSGGGYGGALSHLGTSQSSGLGLTTHSSASSSRNHPSILSNQLRQTSNANSSSSGSGPAGIPTTSLNRGASSSSALSGRVSFKNGEQNQNGPLFAAGANNNSPTHDVKPFTSWRTNNSHRRGTSWGSSYLGGIVEAGSGSERSSPIRASPAGGTGQIQKNISNNNNPIAGDRLSQYHSLPSTNPTPIKETSFDTGGGKYIKETPEEYRQTSPPSKQPQQQQQQQQIRQRQNPSFDTKTIIDNKAEGLLDRGDVNVPPLDTTNNDTTTHQHNFKKKERVTSVHIGRQSIVSVLGMDESIGNDSNKVFTVVQNFSGGLEKQPSIDEDDLSFSVKDDIDTSRTNKRHSNSNIVIHLTTDEAEEVSIGSPTAQRDIKEVSCYYEEERMDDAANELTTPMETSFESIMDHSSIASPTGGVLRQISERTFEGGSTISNVTNK